jgi:acyl transferase domain-containing protein/acyl carrier protein/phospholipid N-methyltransferase
MASREFLDRLNKLSPKQLALLALELQEKVDRLGKPAAPPIAIVGMSCRFPGDASSPEAYWQLLAAGIDAIRETPADRWDVDALYDPNPDAQGKIATRWGGFLADVTGFDADFFGITPREAMNMDPQQRLVLEVAWEALERAGYAPDGLERTRTGVFLGLCNTDYFQVNGNDPNSITAYLASGAAGSVASGRLSYLLGLQGPSISIDTACSSSLIAIHLACQSLRAGECTMAVAGGVNVILRPEVSMALSRAHMMAPDGRCKAFDSRADGFVRAEGCGLLVLKPLADAQAAGDTILAVIRGSAANQDGRSSGITAPNGPSQEAVIRDALAMAGLKPADIGYVEAHGTGTSLGDPIEIQALGAALGEGRAADAPLLVGSVKTNIGHLESAAGVAGLMKVVLSLRNRTIPPHLHLRERNPHVDWSRLNVAIPTSVTPWPTYARTLAGVSSFGFSGTNAHVILEEAPAQPESDKSAPGPFVLPLSAKNETALKQLAQRYAAHLQEHPNENLADVCYTAAVGRAHFDHRLAVVGADRAALVERLNRVASDEDSAGVVRGHAAAAPDVAFLFTGQGSQYVGMGRELYATEPVFRRVILECEQALTGLLPKPLTALLFESDRAELEQTAHLQPALFALEVALAALWKSWGITPSIVTGHSLGELSAACVAGVFDVATGAKLVAMRGRLMQAVRGQGRMAAVMADEATVRRAIASRAREVAIAAINGPTQLVISGYAAAIGEVARELDAAGVRVRMLDVSHAFHSPQMDAMLAEFETEARRFTYREPRIDIVSNVTGNLWGATEIADPAAYWRRHVRATVEFARGMSTVAAHGCRVFIEIGPNPVLLGMGRQCIAAEDAQWLPSLKHDRGEREQIIDTLARLYSVGVRIDWQGVYASDKRRRVVLPTYPFQPRRFWTSSSSATRASRPAVLDSDSVHPLGGARLDTAVATFEIGLDLECLPYLADHRIGGRIVAPGALLLEATRTTAARFFESEDARVEDVRFREMLVVPESGQCRVHISFVRGTDGTVHFQIHSRPTDSPKAEWTHHVEGRVAPMTGSSAAESTFAETRRRCTDALNVDEFYAQLPAKGIEFGPAFRGISELLAGPGVVVARATLPQASGHQGSTCAPYHIHPALLDAAFQVMGAAVVRSGRRETFMQVGLGALNLTKTAPTELWVVAHLRDDPTSDELSGDIQLYDSAGTSLGTLDGVVLKVVPPPLLGNAGNVPHPDWLYEVVWREASTAAAADLPTLAEKLRASLAPLSTRYGLVDYDTLSPQIDSVGALFVARALEQLGVTLEPGATVTAESMRAKARVLPAFGRLFDRMLQILAEEGVLRVQGAGSWTVLSRLPAGDPAARCRRLLEAHRSYDAELTLLARCGEHLAQVLQGNQDPLQLLFPGGDTAVLEGLYRDSPSAHVFNSLARDAVADLVARSGGAPLRVLEIGAGTGATTQYVLQVLPPETEYVFTDLSPHLVSRAQRAFANRPNVVCKVFDVDDKSPLEQGFVPQTFDIVVAANVLHATRYLARTVGRVVELLKPGGTLVLLEGTRKLRWVDLTFGMTEGWWRFADHDLRPNHALLQPAQWASLLGKCGFAEVESIPTGVEAAGQALIVARVPDLTKSDASVEGKGRWIVCAETLAQGRALAAECAARSIQCVVVSRTAREVPANVDEYVLRGTDAADLSEIWDRVMGARTPRVSAVIFVAATVRASEDPASVVLRDGMAATAWLRQLARTERAPALWIATCGAQPVNGTAPMNIEQAALWGWARVAALEHPDVFGGVIDFDAARETDRAAALLDAIEGEGAEDQIGWRDGRRFVARLARASIGKTQGFEWRPDRSYLVTGWMGGLGLLLVQWLADRGVRHLVLVGRRALPQVSEATDVIVALQEHGVNTTIVQADVADEAAMTALFARFGQDVAPLAGVFHVAANLSSHTLDALDEAAYRATVAPKVGGAWLLHRLTEELALHCFVLFSSTTALLGAQGLAHYAAANTALDSLAHLRTAAGLPALSVNWGTWERMRRASAQEQAFYESAGLKPMPAGDALDLLEIALGAARSQLAVAAIDWDVLKPVYEARRPRPFQREVSAWRAAMPAARTATPAKTSKTWRLEDIPASERSDKLAELVRIEVARVIGLSDPSEVDLLRGLFEMGMDSLMAVELRANLEKRAGRPLPSTLTFNYPNVTALAGYFEKVLFAAPAAPAVPAAASAQAAPAAAPPPVTADTSREDLSEEHLERLLAEKLKTL